MQKLSSLLEQYYISNIDNLEELVQEKKEEKSDYFFKNILFFTNERDPKKNKTLKNLEDAIKGKNINLVTFIAAEVTYEADEEHIAIWDEKTEYTIKEQSNVDTIVIVRLGAQDELECTECIKELQNWGLFVINPINKGLIASNKYQAAVLLEKHEIPQPRYCLLTIEDVKDGEKSLAEKLEVIYPNYKKLKEKEQKELEYVIKILDGHGGYGVCMCDGSSILSILQAMFAVDEELELLLQKKEEIDGGDIRVHVLTTRTDQKVLASMKRIKLGGDFRSNVSLGAEVEPIEITDEQKEIALKVAKISGMPWCAVDIAPLVKDSNPEIGDNIVLEYNASPGTQGISEAIGENFMSVLLDSINDVNELVLSSKAIGYKENMKIFFENEDKYIEYEAKLDTGNGAKASTIGVDKVEVNGDDVIATIGEHKYKFKKHSTSKAIVGQATEERTTVIIPMIKLGTRKLPNVEFSLVDNRDKSTKVLLNRDVLSKLGYLIDPSAKHILDRENS